MTDEERYYNQIAQAVGDVCLWWVNNESVVHDIVLHLAAYIDPEFENRSSWDILHIALLNMDIRQKISTAKVLAHHVDTAHSPDFYDRSEALLNYLDNIARPERNRFVHDYWHSDGRAVLRRKLGARVHRPQSRQRVLSLHTERRYHDLGSVRGFVSNLELAYRDLVDLDNHIAWLTEQRDSPGSHSQPLPEEWRSLAHRDWREPNTP